MNAYEDVVEFLREGEKVEAIVFGAWGWGSEPEEGDLWEFGYKEPGEDDGVPLVPFGLRGRMMSLSKAKPYMEGWSFYGGHGAPECYAVYIWTDQRVIWVTQYDGSTMLDDAPRNPQSVLPEMPGA